MKRAFLLIITGVLFFSTTTLVRANDIFTDPLADSADQFFLATPTANQKVKNTIVISVRAFDDEQSQVPASVEIWDSATCRSSKLGTISNTNFSSSSVVNNDIGWNTKANVGAAPLTDGDYCLKVCLTLKDGNNYYTACNGRRVRVLNNNRLPVINSLPQQLSVYENDAWQYDVNATDPDNDPVTYRLVQTANFLTIDPSTGLIRRVGPNISFPAGVTRLDYTIVVAADDNFSGAATQQFVLSILKRPPVVVPPTPGQPEPPVEEEPEVINTAAQITFINPTENQIFKGANNKISWKIVDPDGLAEGYLLFAKSEVNPEFDIIFDFNSIETTSFIWDVTNLADGKYFLNLVAIDSDQVETVKRSPTFIIQNQEPVEPEPEPGAMIEFRNLLPQNDATLNLRRPEVTGQFLASEGAEPDISTFQFFLNGEDKTNSCTVSLVDFKCVVDQDLVDGTYEIKLVIKAKEGETTEVTSSFNIDAEEIVSFPTDGDNVPFLGIMIPRSVVNLVLILCALTFLLLFIPWLLIRMWKKDDTEEDEVVTTTTTDYSDPYSTFDTSSYFVTPTTEKKVVEEVKTTTPLYPVGPVITETAPVVENTDVRAQIVADYSNPSYVTDLKTEPEGPTINVTAPVIAPEPTPEVTDKPTPAPATETVATEKPLADKTEEEIMQDYYKYINPEGDQTFVEPTPTDEPTPPATPTA